MMSTKKQRRLLSQFKSPQNLKLTWQILLSALILLVAFCYDICMAKCGSRTDVGHTLQGSRQQESRDIIRQPLHGTHNSDQMFRLISRSISLKTLTRRLSRLSAMFEERVALKLPHASVIYRWISRNDTSLKILTTFSKLSGQIISRRVRLQCADEMNCR